MQVGHQGFVSSVQAFNATALKQIPSPGVLSGLGCHTENLRWLQAIYEDFWGSWH